MTELEKYEAVNKSSSLKELANVIRSFAIDGRIQGRTKTFDSEQMAIKCENYSLAKHNNLTREFGIRQQAMMLLFYETQVNRFSVSDCSVEMCDPKDCSNGCSIYGCQKMNSWPI